MAPVQYTSSKEGFTNSNIQFNTDKAVSADDALLTKFTYENSIVEKDPSTGRLSVTPTAIDYQFKVDLKVPKVGLLLVGLGGNNGSTLVSSILANKHNISFENKEGVVKPNYYGSVTQSSTIKLGIDKETGNDVYAPFNSVVPLVNPNDLIVGGWDINGLSLDAAMQRAKVLDIDLQKKLTPYLKEYKPLPSVYYPDFIALNQKDRADNIINKTESGEIRTDNKWADVEKIRKDIRDFKESNKLDKVIVLWTANTERYADVIDGVNDNVDNLLASIKNNHDEIAPSTIFAVASILEKVPYINGSPQNTFVPGVIALAEKEGSFIGGDDFKSGQTKLA